MNYNEMNYTDTVYYYFDLLSDNDIINETECYSNNMMLIKSLLEDTNTLRYININDEFDTELVLYNEDDEYMLMFTEDYEEENAERMITGDKHYIFHFITGFLNSNWALDEIEILGE